MSYKLKIPLEQAAPIEAEENKVSWSSGLFNFLLSRTTGKYSHKANRFRRIAIESNLKLHLPEITDEILRSLYEHSCIKYQHKCQMKYDLNSGFCKTEPERIFLRTLEHVIKTNPKLKHLEVYPSDFQSADRPQGLKMVIGNYIPDFLVFGIKDKKFSSVSIEINGDSHIKKWEKDQVRNDHLAELKIYTLEIPNNQVGDIGFLSGTLNDMYRLRNGSFNGQIRRVKRLIWTKTVACQMGIAEIESFVFDRYSLHSAPKRCVTVAATSWLAGQLPM